MANEAIFSIKFDTSELKAALAQLEQVRELAGRKQTINTGVNTGSKGASGSASSNTEGGTVGSENDARATFNRVAPRGIFGGTTNARFLTDRRLTGSDSNIAKYAKFSQQIATYWKATSKELSRGGKALAEMVRLQLKSVSIGAVGGVIGAAAAVGGAAIKSAEDLAAQNLTNRELGLQPGEKEAVEADYAKAGMRPGMIEWMAQAKNNRSEWSKLYALGFSNDQIEHESAAQLAQEALERSGEMYRKYGESYGQWAAGMHLDSLFGVNTARAASTYSDADYAEMRRNAVADQQRLAVSRAGLDEGTEAARRWAIAKGTIINSLEGALVKLAPDLTKLAITVGDAVKSFLGSPELGPDLEALGHGIRDAITWFRNLTGTPPDAASNAWNDDSPGTWNPMDKDTGNPPKGSNGVVAAAVGGTIVGSAKLARAVFDAQTRPSLTFTPDANRNADFTRYEQQNALEPGDVNALEQLESSGGRENVGPITRYGWRAMGPFQFSPDSLKQYGVHDAGNEKEEGAAAARKLRDLLAEFRGNRKAAYAAYNAGDRTIKDLQTKYGTDWDKHLGPQTTQYLLRAQQLYGVDFDHTTGGAIRSGMNDVKGGSGANMAADNLVSALDRNTAALRTQKQGAQSGAPASVKVIVQTPPGANLVTTTAMQGIAQ